MNGTTSATTSATASSTAGDMLEAVLLHHEINQINAAYAAALDERRFAEWPDFFVPDGRYRVQARENHDRGLPLCLMDLESQGMMKDRVHGITQTIYHGPYYTRHVVGAALLLPAPEGEEAGAVLRSQTHYAVFRTKPGSVSEVFSVGRYLDEWVRTGAGLKLQSRHCVYDSEMILNSLIYPI